MGAGLSCADAAALNWRKNKFGVYTFLMYWFMHQSAKLNIFWV
ncbi:MAG: hypothetical protein CMR00_12115 [[Chlorobium] sp. 445]|nr:MAG: hypothetical protein CMR00_12115 [[Chlorobium] sp. 445]